MIFFYQIINLNTSEKWWVSNSFDLWSYW